MRAPRVSTWLLLNKVVIDVKVLVYITPKWPLYGMTLSMALRERHFGLYTKWSKPLKKSLRLPLSSIGEKGEENPRIMVLDTHEHDVGFT